MTSPLGILHHRVRRLRRRVLTHRRPLAALLALVAVLVGLQAARPGAPATAALLVAGHDLAAGTVLRGRDLTTVRVPPGAVPAGAQPDPAGRVLASAVRRGEPITDLRLVGPRLAAGHPDLVAVPVRLPDPAMAALLRVGDRVRLLATDTQGGTTTTVADDALVLALPDGAPDTSGTGSGAAPDGGSGPLGGRLVVVGVPEGLVDRVTAAAVRDFLTFAYPH